MTLKNFDYPNIMTKHFGMYHFWCMLFSIIREERKVKHTEKLAGGAYADHFKSAKTNYGKEE